MTNKQQAQALWGKLTDETLTLAIRQAAREELLALKKTAKTSILKLVGTDIAGDQLLVDAVMDQSFESPMERFPDGQLTRVFDPANYGISETVKIDPFDEEATKSWDEEHLKPIDPIAKLQKPKSDTKGDNRGLISAMVRCQLMDTDDSYAVIVGRVKAKFPNANTSTRSVASVASDLRKDGVAVASRRQIKGA
jgi:hypothetical protein